MVIKNKKMDSLKPTLAKISRPIGRLIGRSALVERIAAAPAPLVWIAAPAGSGKTSVGISFAQAQTGPVAWLRLDESDADPAHFLQYLEQALLHAGAAVGWNAPPLLQVHLPAIGAYLRVFARSLAPCWATPAWLVLDDVHRCQSTPFFRQFLEVFAEELPPGVRLLVLSRQEPPEDCARLLAHQKLCEIPGSALTLSLEETAALLASLEVNRAQELSVAVHAFTGGWAAGTALLAALQKRHAGAVPAPDRTLPRLVAGYLATEVFDALGAGERQALLAVCRLPYFTGAWAARLSGDPSAAQAVARLTAQGILINEYEGHRYVLHHLLASFLREHAQQHCDAEQCAAWVAASVELLVEEANFEDAVELALEAGLHARAARLVEQIGEKSLAQARHKSVARWVAALPEDHRTAILWHWLGAAHVPIDPSLARRYLLQACAAFRAEGKPEQRFLSLSPAIRSYYLNAAGTEPLHEVLARELAVGDDYEALKDPAVKAPLALSVFSGLTITDAAHPELPLWEARTMACVRASQDPLFKAPAAITHVHNDFLRGRYRRIGAVRTALEAPPGAVGGHVYARYLAFATFLYDALVRFDHAAVARNFAESRAIADGIGVQYMNGHYAIDMATDLLLQGRCREAMEALDQVAAATRPGQYNLAGHMHMIRGWAALLAGEADQALEHARLLRQAAAGFGDGCPYAVCADILEAIHCALAAPEDAPARCAALRAHDARRDFPVAAIHADLLEAWLALRRGDHAAVLAPLTFALARLADESGGYLSFALPGILAPLCAEALDAGIETAFVQELIRQWRLAPPAAAGPNWPRPVAVRSFGGFELRVNGAPLASRGKSKHRQIDLLKLLVAHAPAAVPVALAAESLWPDSDGDAARHALETTVSRLRASLGAEAIRLEHGALALDPALCWSDTQALDATLEKLESAKADSVEWAPLAEAVLGCYRGDLLAGESHAWLLSRREYWRGRVGRVLGHCARARARQGELESALRLLDRSLEVDPYCEPLTETYMRLCLEAGRPATGLAAYRRYRRIALSALGASVAPEMEALAERLQHPPSA